VAVTRITSIVLAVALAALPPTVRAASPMQPGTWESTVTIARAGQVPVVSTDRDCVTQKEIDDGTKSMPRPGGDCQLSNVVTDNAATSYAFACTTGKATLSGTAEFKIEATRYDGKVTATTQTANGPATALTMTWSARRVGECR